MVLRLHPCIYLASLFLLCISCGPRIYQAPDFTRQTRGHKIVAILPSDVTIRLRPNQAAKYTQEQLSSMEKETGFEIQNAIYLWLLKRSAKYEYTVKFQDINKTNSKLKELNIEIDELNSYDLQRLANELQVDALISNSTYMDKPMSEGAAIVVGALLGSWGATNKVKTTISINDADSGDLLWKYDYQFSGSIGSTPDNLVTSLMRNASRKFPYQINR